MPLMLTSILSAMVLTYLLSRLFFRSLAALTNPVRLLASHLASWLLLAAAVGLLKAYFTSFAYQQTIVLILPQLFWLGLDLLRGLGDRTYNYGTSTRGSRSK